MCGIAGIFGRPDEGRLRRMLDQQKHRGPAGRTLRTSPYGVALGHDRAASVGPQPVANEDGSLWLLLDGEIYNAGELRRSLAQRHTFATDSGAEVALHLFEAHGPGFLSLLDGVFALAIWGASAGLFLARDPLGVRPLYWGEDRHGSLLFASEIKALVDQVEAVQELPRGHYWHVGLPMVQYEGVPRPQVELGDPDQAVARLDQALEAAVVKRLKAPQPVGCLLSGGLDSSLVAAIMRRHVAGDLRTFAVGVADSPDLVNARHVAAELGAVHHERVLTEGEIIEALPRVIDLLESCDPPLVRSAIPAYFVAETAAQHVGVVMSGEGADELFGGYQYLAEFDPDGMALNRELHQITGGLYNSGLQRVDRMTMAHSLVPRLPLLDRAVVKLAFRMDPALKRRPGGSKWVLRKLAEKYLPDSVVWRAKEKFSIGTGAGSVLERYANRTVTEADLARELSPKGVRFQIKEEYLYWQLFRDRYGRDDVLACMGRSRSLNPGKRWASAL